MVDKDNTRRTMPGVWHRLNPGEQKDLNLMSQSKPVYKEWGVVYIRFGTL